MWRQRTSASGTLSTKLCGASLTRGASCSGASWPPSRNSSPPTVRFASYCEVEQCVGVASGTDALVLALRACKIGPGDEVIAPSLTFFAGPMAIASVGAVPVFVDVDETVVAVDPDLVRAAITPRTRAIMPVHLYGRCVDLDRLEQLAGERGLWLIEDAAQAHGARWNGRRAGSAGALGC